MAMVESNSERGKVRLIVIEGVGHLLYEHAGQGAESFRIGDITAIGQHKYGDSWADVRPDRFGDKYRATFQGVPVGELIGVVESSPMPYYMRKQLAEAFMIMNGPHLDPVAKPEKCCGSAESAATAPAAKD